MRCDIDRPKSKRLFIFGRPRKIVIWYGIEDVFYHSYTSYNLSMVHIQLRNAVFTIYP